MQWALVYILEAHAADTWPLKFSFERPRPTSLAQRAAYACEASGALGLGGAGFRVLVDGMDDAFNTAFGAWPTAYYLLDRAGTLLHVGEADADAETFDVRRFLAAVRRCARETRVEHGT